MNSIMKLKKDYKVKYAFLIILYRFINLFESVLFYSTSKYINIFVCKNVTLRHAHFFKLIQSTALKLLFNMLQDDRYKIMYLNSEYWNFK